jgi:hypothetical protein
MATRRQNNILRLRNLQPDRLRCLTQVLTRAIVVRRFYVGNSCSVASLGDLSQIGLLFNESCDNKI